MDTEPEEIIILPEEDDSINLEKFSWDKEVTSALITEYKKYRNEFNNPTKKKKILWQQIAQNLIKQGFTLVRTEHCEKKWRNLKKTFKDIYLGKRSCKTRTKWGFYDTLGEIFANDPEIIRHANLLKRNNEIFIDSKNKFIASEEHGVVIMDTVEDSCEEVENTDNFNMIETEDTEEQQPPNWFLTFLQQYKEDEERKIEILQNMHSEIVALERQKCFLLEKLIKKLPYKIDSEPDSCADNEEIKTDNDEKKTS